MNSEQLLELASSQSSFRYLEALCKNLFKEWVYFYIIDDGTFLQVGSQSISNIEEIVNTGKDRPITIPYISNENGRNAVIYLSKEKSIQCVEMKCRIGKMKGKDAFNMFKGMNDIDGVCIQGNNSWILLPREKLEELVACPA